ncbi:MAG TPA: hypothetical protein VEW25_12895 [Allosphingosinicella sp.]|nr:hypothetical protein [Allosphingosinicella sp.]
MGPFEMVVAIVVVTMIANVIMVRMKHRHEREKNAASPEADRLRAEVSELKERLAVLERIAVDKESSLEREIERLRDR